MKVFAVSYDLRHAGSEQYKELYKTLRRLNGIQVLKSTWTLKLEDNWTCQEVGRVLIKHIDGDEDGLFVAEVLSYAGINCDNEPHDF